jgi:hypothetical protein
VCSEYWCDVVRLMDEGRKRREEERKEKGNVNALPPRGCAHRPLSLPNFYMSFNPRYPGPSMLTLIILMIAVV